VGDFDGSGFADLAVGSAQEDIWISGNAGAVNVLYGSLSGLSASGNQLWHQNSPGILGISQRGDLFGNAVASAS
jgi:hypothetical protein